MQTEVAKDAVRGTASRGGNGTVDLDQASERHPGRRQRGGVQMPGTFGTHERLEAIQVAQPLLRPPEMRLQHRAFDGAFAAEEFVLGSHPDWEGLEAPYSSIEGSAGVATPLSRFGSMAFGARDSAPRYRRGTILPDIM